MKLRLNDIKLTDRQKTFLIILLFILGILLVMLPSGEKKQDNSGTKLVGTTEYRQSLETRLEEMLTAVEGVGDVKVMITLKGENSKTIAYNENRSVSVSNTSNREDTSKDAVLIRDSTGSIPYTLNENYPEVSGVLVVSEGAEDSVTKSYIISAVKSTLGVKANNITVLPMGSEK